MTLLRTLPYLNAYEHLFFRSSWCTKMTARSALCVLIGYGADLLPHSDEGKDSFTRRVLGREEEDSSNTVDSDAASQCVPASERLVVDPTFDKSQVGSHAGLVEAPAVVFEEISSPRSGEKENVSEKVFFSCQGDAQLICW